MLATAQHRFNVSEYYRMAETGVLAYDARVELLDGQIIDMSPIGPFHGKVTKFLIRFFESAAKNRWITTVTDPVHLDDHSEPQPDVMLLKPSSDFYGNEHPRPQDVLLLVEISDTSLEKDQEIKLPAYARAGIAEVWIINLNDQSIEVHRQPHLAGYAVKTILPLGDTASPQLFPDVKLDVAELLKR